ncbi:MAG: PKD domain-containing protein [bacterium]
MKLSTLVAVFILLAALGCSGAGQVASPDLTQPSERILSQSTSHQLWGYWQVAANPSEGTFEMVPDRTSLLHVNVVPLLEPPAGLKLKVSNLMFDGSKCNVDVTLVHPFPGLSQYIGFDVAGIFISKGTYAGFADPDLIMAGAGDSRLLNPDGYTRWWNPVEFSTPGLKLFRYRDGLLGNKNSIANYNCTLNGYKMFSNELGKNDDIMDSDPSTRLPFFDGATNTRHYTIDFSGGVVFNYAVDANWQMPDGDAPFTPDDYAPDANRPEAWAISVSEIENTLFNNGSDQGGILSLAIDVWDHFNADLNTVTLDSPGNFDPISSLTPVGGGDGYSTYIIDIVDATPNPDSIDILVEIQSEVTGYTDALPDKPITAYFTYNAKVSGSTTEPPTAIMEATTPTDITYGDSVSFDATASTGTPPLTFEWDFNGDGIYDGPADTYTNTPEMPTHEFDQIGDIDVTVKVTNGAGFDISDPVTVHVAYDSLDIFVDGDYTGGSNDGTPQHPFTTIQPAMAAVTSGHTIHVDYLDGGNNTYDTAGLQVKANITLIGDNWNGGGPGKPKLDNATDMYVITGPYGSVSNFTLEGFQLGVANVPGSDEHFGVYLYGGSNIKISHNKFSDTADDTGLTDGDGIPIYLSGCSDSTIEYNDIGPFLWTSDTAGEYATVLWGIYTYGCNNLTVKNNYIHDYTVDYDGGGGQIRVFLLHVQDSAYAEIKNNLICHIYGINNYDYRINGINIEGYSGTHEYHVYNNTVDFLDTSTSTASTSPIGLICYSASFFPPWTNTYVNNSLVTNIYPHNAGSAGGFYGTTWDGPVYPSISYCTGYNLSTITNYFGSSWNFGDGITNYPGINPQYVNNTTEPYDYHYQSGSGCEMGDPNFIDWDDTGAPSGNPGETNIQNRSRMGCFGGPGGNWDPNDL